MAGDRGVRRLGRNVQEGPIVQRLPNDLRKRSCQATRSTRRPVQGAPSSSATCALAAAKREG